MTTDYDQPSPGRNWRAKLDKCVHGHWLEDENLILRPIAGKPGQFHRQCRECGRARSRAYYRRKKESNASAS